MAGQIVMDRDFFEFIECCAAHEVRYLIVGGWAMAAHGHPRATKDIDFWIRLDPDNAARMVAALADFGFGASGLTVEDLMDPQVIVQLGHPPKRIEVLATIDGVDFDRVRLLWRDVWESLIGAVSRGFVLER